MKNNRWLVLFLAFLCNNVAMAVTFGAFGVMSAKIAMGLGITQSMTSLGVGLVSLMMGLTSPFIGMLLDRWSIRGTIMIGCLVSALGLYTASMAETVTGYLIGYGLLLGIGMTAMGILPAAKMASTAFPQATGKAVGVVTLSISMAASPPIFGYIAEHHGWRNLMQSMALLPLMILPICWLSLTPRFGQIDSLVKSPIAAKGAGEPVPSVLRAIISQPIFWLIMIISGILLSSGILIYAHIANHALHIGYSLSEAAFLISVAGFSAIVGSLGYGWIADRFSPAIAIAINALAQGGMWLCFMLTTAPVVLYLAIAVGGFSAAGAYAAISALISKRYGAQRVGILLGQLALFVMPFNFGMPPLFGWIFDTTGTYNTAFLLVASGCLVSLLAIVLISARGPWSAGMPEAV